MYEAHIGKAHLKVVAFITKRQFAKSILTFLSFLLRYVQKSDSLNWCYSNNIHTIFCLRLNVKCIRSSTSTFLYVKHIGLLYSVCKSFRVLIASSTIVYTIVLWMKWIFGYSCSGKKFIIINLASCKKGHTFNIDFH